MKNFVGLLLLLLSFTAIQGQVDSNVIKVSPVGTLQPDQYTLIGKSINGKAGTYSAKADGSKTANGEKLNNAGFTGGNNNFKLGSLVQVTNLKNNKTVVVRINDRTSKKKGSAIIELTRAAVGVLGFLNTGKANVKLQEIIITDSNSIYNQNKIIKDSVIVLKQDLPLKDTFVFNGKPVFGIASFYSSNLDGTKTTTGERYRNALMTAASNNFKMNTWVLVTNLKNQKTVIVRINDHMHPRMKKKGRVVDLSRDAARKLDFIDDGLTKVKVEKITFISNDSLLNVSRDTIQEKIQPLIQQDTVKIDSIVPIRKIVTGVASFYSKSLDGTKTATGEIYRNNKLSAASNDFELNTWVKITNLKNNKTVTLRINDRMHPKMQKKGRVVDVSRIAAKRLDFIENGLTKVQVEPLDKKTLE